MASSSRQNKIDTWLDEWEELREKNPRLNISNYIKNRLVRESPENIRHFKSCVRRLSAFQRLVEIETATRGQSRRGPFLAEAARFFEGDEPISGYKLKKCLGRGGFGEVWGGWAPGKIPVAMKLITHVSSARQEHRALDIVRQIRHPHLIGVHRAEVNDKTLVIVMELATRSLRDQLEESRNSGLRGIAFPVLMGYMYGIAKALDYLNAPQHRYLDKPGRRVQHLDVKPDNILLVGGEAKLADWGIAQFMAADGTDSRCASGTLNYMAPERFPPRFDITPSSDQYSLAVTYCELRTGELSFVFGEPCRKHRWSQINLDHLAPVERTIVARALAEDPNARWPSCTAFVIALDRALQSKPEKISRRSVAVAALGLMLFLAALYLFFSSDPAESIKGTLSGVEREEPGQPPLQPQPQPAPQSLPGKSAVEEPVAPPVVRMPPKEPVWPPTPPSSVSRPKAPPGINTNEQVAKVSTEEKTTEPPANDAAPPAAATAPNDQAKDEQKTDESPKIMALQNLPPFKRIGTSPPDWPPGFKDQQRLSMHPPWASGPGNYSGAQFQIHKQYVKFESEYGVDRASSGRMSQGSAVYFTLLGDGKRLWQSGGISVSQQYKRISVPIVGVNVLELRTHVVGNANHAHASWRNPVVIRRDGI